jgi:hypothetical protein
MSGEKKDGLMADNPKDLSQNSPQESVENREESPAQRPPKVKVDDDIDFWTEDNDIGGDEDSGSDALFESDFEDDGGDWFEPEAVKDALAAEVEAAAAAGQKGREAPANENKGRAFPDRTSAPAENKEVWDPAVEAAFSKLKIEGLDHREGNDDLEAEIDSVEQKKSLPDWSSGSPWSRFGG